MKSNGKAKVLLVKHWMECHDRGVKSVATILRDAGFEVVYVVYMSPEEIVAAAVEEDVNVIGMSFSTQAYDAHVPEVMKMLKEKGMGDVMVLVGGLIPDEDIDWLKQQGVREVFGAGADTDQLIELVGTAAR
ncbi:MAG: cobalamin-dependent protein [Dehalococcoidia bacterium]|nr:MAG: cobalamin-dependent protein [Dehalococcoidia bacterium]